MPLHCELVHSPLGTIFPFILKALICISKLVVGRRFRKNFFSTPPSTLRSTHRIIIVCCRLGDITLLLSVSMMKLDILLLPFRITLSTIYMVGFFLPSIFLVYGPREPFPTEKIPLSSLIESLNHSFFNLIKSAIS